MSESIGIVTRVSRNPAGFLALFFLIFFAFSVFLFAIDFVPEKPTQNETATTTVKAFAVASVIPEIPDVPEVPVRVEVPKAGIDINIQNPLTSDLPTLNKEVNKGAVHYPGSALLGENAAIFLFAHQSYLPALKNPAYKAFNNLEKLAEGDEIRLYSENAIYLYRVRSVQLKRASEAQINLEKGYRMLTMSTCNSVGAKEERFVLVADFVLKKPLIQNS